MSIEWLVTNFLSAWLLPPLNLIVVLAVGLALIRKRPRTGLALSAGALALLAVLSMPIAGTLLIATLETDMQPVTATQISSSGAGAIVILGSGRRRSPEYGGLTVSNGALGRMRYGARLARETQLPVLVAGGKPGAAGASEADLMADALEQDFGVKVRWREDESINTIENARFSARLLHPAGIKRVVLVTDASHMKRSIARFRAAGFEVVPAPTGYSGQPEFNLIGFLPAAGGLDTSSRAFREWIGILVSRARGV